MAVMTIINASHKRLSAAIPAKALTLMQATVLCTLSSLAAADDLFIPNLDNDKSEAEGKHRLSSLCNKGLALRVEQIRSDEMSAEHRALNYQWLAAHAGKERQYEGGRAFSRIAQKVLREYWKDKRRELGDKAMLDSDGNLKRQYHGIDYGLTTSGGGLNIGLNYQF